MPRKNNTFLHIRQVTLGLLTTMVVLLAACSQVESPTPAAPTTTLPATLTFTVTTTPLQYRTATRTHTPTSTATQTPTAASTRTPTLTDTPSPTSDLVVAPIGQARVPILLYHHVSDAGKTRYFTSTANFRAQMKFLANAGYKTISISQLANIIRNGGSLPPKPVVLTFDDGFEDIYQNALPILKEYGFTGVAYIITGTLDSNLSYGYMQSEELKDLVNAGWEIGSHSVSHNDLRTSKLGMGTEMQKSKKDLEDLLDIPIHSFSYPYGIANSWIENLTEKYGYDSAVGLDIDVTQTTKRLYYLSRREVYYNTSLSEYKDLLVPGRAELIELGQLTETPPP